MAKQKITRAHGRNSQTMIHESDDEKTIAGPARVRGEGTRRARRKP